MRCSITTLLTIAALVFAGRCFAADQPPTAVLAELTIFSDGWPRAFFFRACEGMAANPRISFDLWDRTFSRLMGIEGKVLDEEIPGRSRRNISFFVRFKQLHPRQLVLLHYNGNARDPRDAAGKFFAGHWVYYTGCRITRDLPAEDGISELYVEDPRLFRTGIGRYGDKNEDIGLCLLDSQGRPDWRYSEQVQLVAKDPRRGVLRVRHGCYGTRPRFFPAGRAYAAAHVTEGPWGRKSNLLWFYNYSPRCPRDVSGRTCVDVLVDDLARLFEPGGPLGAFDGIEFDVLAFRRWYEDPARYGLRGIDTDADGRHDGGFYNGVNVYGIGVYEFARRLRRRLGDRKLILADGTSPTAQRCFGQFNGIESEGWPNLSDWDFRDWSGGLNRHLYWNAFGRKPAFSYINHKYIAGAEGRRAKLPFSRHRLALAAAQLVDAAVCYSFAPPWPRGELYPIWDELVGGRLGQPGWLGKPSGPARRLGLDAPDLLGGAGRRWPVEFVGRWRGIDTVVGRDAGALKLRGTAGSRRVYAILQGLPVRGPDLLIRLKMRAAPRRGYPREIPRLVWVGLARPETWLVRRFPPPRTGMCRRGRPEEPLDPASGATVRYMPALELGGEKREAYFTHPPYKAGPPGYVFWEREVTVPARARLKFAIGMGRLSPQRSDGVVFSVAVRPASGHLWQTVFRKLYNEFRWQEQEVSLEQWAGQRVVLRFTADCGPRDDTTTDHAAWGDVRIVQAGRPEQWVRPERHMTFCGPQAFTSTFYFRPLAVKQVDVFVEVEGAEPVWIDYMTAHAAADVQVRAFEHGAVLANPSTHEVVVDLAKLLPGRRFRRLTATAAQDTSVNNGQPVGDRITLPPLDALFLLAD